MNNISSILSADAKFFSPNDNKLLNRYFNKLKKKNYNEKFNGYLPDWDISIRKIYNIISELYNHYDEVIVFAFDAISYQYYMQEVNHYSLDFSGYKVSMLSSVFPSTSSTSWGSILTGTKPSEHGIYGTSFLLENYNKNYIWHRNVLSHKGERKILGSKDKFKLVATDRPTLFELLSDKGVVSYSLGTNFQGEFKPLLNDLYKGSIRIRIKNDYLSFTEKPNEMLDYFFCQNEELLKINECEKLLIWNYIDTDYFIHVNGYDVLTNSINWKRVFDFWEKHSKKNRAFLFISDHGQIQQKNIKINIFDVSNENEDLAYDTAGAGRVIYAYPKVGKEEQVKLWLEKLMKDNGYVISKKDLVELNLLDENANCIERMGDIIAIARNASFPSTGYSYLFEHGAFEQDEMYVPITIKLGEEV
ncbi:alkaline phosphatase family protein [Paenibacillus sp. T2-29]|uniref:alkaline phosphatase family protein n=1 Tax=Paenibacillus TaxID=44249 RepID=UPI0039BCC5C9